jgi:ATP-dependent RNA helicase DeaD
VTVEQETEQQTVEQEARPATFDDLKLSPEILEAIEQMGWTAPTEVQVKAIPPAREGHDLQVQSRTGSGKTAAFAIPFAEGLVKAQPAVPQALILCPTRELALQVADECGRIVSKTALRVTAIYGGAAMGPQISALHEGTHIVAGTPGRVLDHIRRGNFKTDAIRVLVLDECDEMLSMGFLEEITSILDTLPPERQTMLFSATIPDEIQHMADRYLKDPVRLHLSEDFIGVREIQHIYYLISGGDRTADLLRVLHYEEPTLALIFCNTREDTAVVADYLRGQGFKAEGISSDLTQAERERVMRHMREGELRFLVATDIAARGIDLSDLSHVINYTFPDSADVYVHRTGRTGRAGKSGIAVSLVAPREIGSFYYLKLIHKIFPEERHLPSVEEIASRREGDRFTHLLKLMEGKRASEEMRGLARRVWSTVDGERVIAMALAHVLSEPGEIFADVKPAAPVPARSEARESSDGERRPRESRDSRDRPRGAREGRDRPRGGRDSREGQSRENDRDGRRSRRARLSGEEEAPRERKTTRTRRRDADEQQPAQPTAESASSEAGTFLTPDGDIERWEVLEGPAPAEERVAETSGNRLFINVGRRQGVRTSELAEFLQREAQLVSEQIAELRIRDTHSYFSVPPELTDLVVERLTGKSYNDRAIRVEKAKR